MPTRKQSQRKRHLGIEFALFMGYVAPLGIALLHTSLKDSALAQLIPDTTQGGESSTVTPTSPTVEQINGGATRGANLFHSFQEFNVGVGRGVYFTNPAGIENILTRVTGTNPSNILGKLGILGEANLFLLNPNGIIFGSGASLDVNGSFVASTANAVRFADGTFFSATNPQTQPLLTINVPIGLQFGTNQPAAIVNAGTLAVKPEQNLGLMGGTVVSTGQLNAPGGQLVVETVFGDGMDTVSSSSLPELLAGAGDETGLTFNNAGGVEVSGSGIPVEAGDVAVRQLNAETATLAATHNLTLVPVEGQEGFEGGVSLQTSGDMNLLARDTVRIRDSVAQPFLAQAGGNLYVQGNLGIDIMALNHLDQATPFQSGGNLSLVSDGVISGDAHFASNGKFEILNLSGGSGNFVSLYDPIISSNSDVYLGNYTGASLKVESRGSITAGDITITTPDTTLSGTDPDIAILTSSPALILRANVSELQNPVSAPLVTAGGTTIRTLSYTVTNLGTLPGDSYSEAYDINDSGQVVGVSVSDNGSRAFLYSGSSPMQALGYLPSGGSSIAYSINNLGQVVGGAFNADGIKRAFIYSGGQMADLGTLPDGSSSVAYDINDLGQVVGVVGGNGINRLSDLVGSVDIDSNSRAFLYSNGTMQDLGNLAGGNPSVAYDINNLGQVVGVSSIDGSIDVFRAFLYSDGTMQNLSIPPSGSSSVAYGINDVGQAVGVSYIDGSVESAFLKNVGQISDLGIPSWGSFSLALDINDSGQVVGLSGGGEGLRPFLYSGGQMIDLNDLIPTGSGWILYTAGAINESGQIVGEGGFDGQTRAFRADPSLSSGITVGNISTAGGPAILQAPIINLTGSSIATNGGNMSFDGPVLLNNSISANSAGGNISFNSTVDGLQNLTLNADTGNVAFNSAVGETIKLGNLTIGSAGSVNTGAISAIGIDITATGAIASTGKLDTSSIFGDGGAISLNAGSNITTSGVSSAATGIGTSGDIHLTSGGTINTTAGTLDSSSLLGNAGTVSLNAANNITTSNITASSVNGIGGDINLTSGDGKIDTTSGSLNSSSVNGNAGAIALSASDDISTGNIFALSDSSTGGTITLTSNNGAIDTTAGDLNASSVNGNAAAIALNADNNITTGNISSSSGNGTGNSISLTSSNGAIDTTAGDFNSSSLTGDAGAIALSADGNITTSNITSASGSGIGGSINLTSSDGEIDTTSGSLNSSSVNGNAGAINLDAANDINTGNIFAFSSSGLGGNITLNSERGAIDTTSGALSSSSIVYVDGQPVYGGNAGAISLEADGNITTGFITAVGGNSGGDLTIATNARFSSASSLILTGTAGLGNSGDINIQANSVALTDGARIAASTTGAGRGGNITVRALESVELSSTNNGRNFISTDTHIGASGDAGNVVLDTGRLIVRDGSGISATANFGSTGRGGNVTVNASDSVEVSGSTSEGNPSIIATGTAGTQSAGDLTINTERLAIRDGAVVLTSTLGNGTGGNLTVNASESVELSGISADGQVPSALSTDTAGTAKAGDLTINTRQFIARDGAAASVSSFGEGQSGNLTLDASESVYLSGTSASGFATGLYAQAFASGNAGNLAITTGDLKVQDGANVTVASRSASDTRFPRVRSEIDLGDGVRFPLPTDTVATGDAGTLKVEADTIFLNRRGSLIASTASGEGGNIDLEAQNYILMRYNSLISAEAGQNGNGGNIRIDTPFVIGVKEENSDIIANAFQGRGGNIYITVQGIYGLQFRPRLTPFSDITASSEVEGQDGVVEIDTPAVDPTQSLTNLPTDFEEPPIDDSCRASGKTASSFVVTGRGGLPPSPDDSLSSDPDLVGLVTPVRRTENRPSSTESTNFPSSIPNAIVEAQGWIIAADGTVVLTAQAPTVTPHSSAFTPPNCQTHREGAGG